jgi:hypothetical protein
MLALAKTENMIRHVHDAFSRHHPLLREFGMLSRRFKM